jgi:hypothetical protein
MRTLRIYDVHQRSHHGRFVIYTDNLNTVDIFNTFRALPPYNHLLTAAVDILLHGEHELRVLHVPGVNNNVADALSRFNFTTALLLVPELKIMPFQPWSWSNDPHGLSTFQPPQLSLGVARL